MSANKQIIKYFIKSAPVGEVQDILEDISNIIGQDFLGLDDIKQALREYYETHMQHIVFIDGRVATVT
jgi:hypothetical protein